MSGDWKSGKRDPAGGGFTYKRLTGTIDGAAVLRMARADMRDTVIFAHFNEGSRRRENLTAIEDDSYTYLVAKNSENEGFFLVWDGEQNTDLTRGLLSHRCGGKGSGHYCRQIPRLRSPLGLSTKDDELLPDP